MKHDLNVTVVVGGQAGSEGKGAVCDFLHRSRKYEYAVRVGGPNAGHSVVGLDGRKWALRQLPVAAVSDPDCDLIIAAGSEIDPKVLNQEIEELEANGHDVLSRLYVDRTATLIQEEDKALEERIETGTTGKGIGGARARRALRQSATVEDWVIDWKPDKLKITDTQALLRHGVASGRSILIEGTQGHMLGSHAGYYPFSTSGDCRAIDFLAWAGLPPMAVEVALVLRTYPIRIAGNSGPLPNETRWEHLDQQPELTTVTRKVRRVGEWNWEWPMQSMQANMGPGEVLPFLMFVDYWHPSLTGQSGAVDFETLPAALRAFLDEFDDRLGVPVHALGTGPDTILEVIA